MVYKNTGILHRLDGPAATYADGGREWWENGKQHRVGDPAVIYADGGREWWENGKLHRIDGPATIYADGYQSWWANGKRHRLDGPAIEDGEGENEWWVNNHHLKGSVLDLFKQAISKTTPHSKLSELSHHENSVVAQTAAHNPNCPLEAQIEWTLTKGLRGVET